MEQIPQWHIGHTSTSNPFASLGTDWCPRCKMECETDMDCVHHVDTFTYKKICCRCGRVICFGMYDQIKILSGIGLPAAAFIWCHEPGKDKR